MAFETRHGARGEGQVLPDGHVGEESLVLEDIAAGALLRREMNARAGVEEDAVVEQDAAGIGFDETGDGIEREGFARTTGSEENGDAGSGFEFDIERELGRFGSSEAGF